MARTLREQAYAVLKSKSSIGKGRSNISMPGKFKAIGSVRSLNDTADALAKIATELGVSRIKHITESACIRYLENRRDNYASQKSIDRDRKALSVALNKELPKYKAVNSVELSSRSYSKAQLVQVTNRMTERNALAVRIAHDAGLRAHELLTLKRVGEGSKTPGREWSSERFSGREGDVYLVTGKGGLTREVMIRKDLALQLESRRLESPVRTTDRGVHYTQSYDLGGGNALSSSFTRASNRALEYSTGLHGVRHSYAQERLDEIKVNLGVSHEKARDILAQELGHFRGSVTNDYLR